VIDSLQALKVISEHRGEAIVVATMTAKDEWFQVSANPDLDLLFSGSMGKASSLALGLALAQPDRKVIVLDGDGSLLMNLGSLVTIANMAPTNLIHFVIENDVYRITGGHPIPSAGRLGFADLARGAGYPRAHEFSDLETFQNRIQAILGEDGPTLICLKVPPASERVPFTSPRTVEILDRFRAALERSSS
jgi:phosphonopyruvate decarboxylase